MFVPEPRASRERLELGRRGETLAVVHLERLGFATIARNVRTRHGEIDLIAFDGLTLLFVEVKTRHVRRGAAGSPLHRHSLGPPELGLPAARQRRRLRRLALAWLSDPGRRRPTARNLRFDVLRVLIGEDEQPLAIEHIEAAC